MANKKARQSNDYQAFLYPRRDLNPHAPKSTTTAFAAPERVRICGLDFLFTVFLKGT